MESGAIKDEDINASSSHSVVSVGPQMARLNKELNSGAWCPSRQISKDIIEYLEISLNSVHIITDVATQGRFGNGQGLEFAEEYMLEYWRPGLTKWLRYRNVLGQEIIKGNTNTYTVVQRKLNPIMIASKIRFIPFSAHLQTVCMRVEVYGCPWNDGVVSYAMPQGERRGSEIDLSDKAYDGMKDDSYLQGGLGQLTDGVVGEDNFKQDNSGMGRGYEWIGWKNDSSSSRPIEIIFTFDEVRNFTAVYFYCNNMHSKDVQVFSSAKFWFSIGGKYFNSPPVNFSYMPDNFFEGARNVTAKLYSQIGMYVKVELTFESKWILLSEISFNSVPAVGNFTEEEPPVAPPFVSTSMSKEAAKTNPYVGLVIGVLAAVILVLIIFILVIIIRNKRRKHSTPHTILKPVDNRVTINMKDLGLTYSQCSPLACQQNGNMYGQNVVLNHADADKLLYEEPQDFKMSYRATYSNESTISREYAVPDITMNTSATSVVPLHQQTSQFNKPAFPQTLPKPFQKPTSEHYYAATDVVKMPNLQGVSGSSIYAVPNGDLLSNEDASAPEIPRHLLHYKEKLGEGQFGEVHLYEADGIDVPQLVDVPCYGCRSLVAVKLLKRNASEHARSDFFKEVRILSKLRDPNIAQVLGVCTRGEPQCMIVEYMEYGDLNEFLHNHVPEIYFAPSEKCDKNKILSHGNLIFMATQIASGMKYLESLNFIHRDMASRNCLVGKGLSIKIADFGMSRDRYLADYCRVEGLAMLPIRWMSWESIFLGRFTIKSDVWAFAVTVWEILTFARQQPFAGWSDDKVIENISHFFYNDGHQLYLPQPDGCPKEIYDLMKECWQRNEQSRPNFKDIHLFLQRKNLGYSSHL